MTTGGLASVAIIMTTEWVNFLVMAAAFLTVATGALIWMFFLRKRRRRRRKHRHHRHTHSPGDDGPANEESSIDRSSGPASTS